MPISLVSVDRAPADRRLAKGLRHRRMVAAATVRAKPDRTRRRLSSRKGERRKGRYPSCQWSHRCTPKINSNWSSRLLQSRLTNLKYMRALAESHPDHAFVQQIVARFPWGHVVRLMENVQDVTRREWYARQAIEHGWSRNTSTRSRATSMSVKERGFTTSHRPTCVCAALW